MNAVPKLAASSIKVLLVGGHTVGRAALRMLIDSQPGLAVIGEAPSPEGAYATCGVSDVLLLDFDRGLDSSANILSDLTDFMKRARVLILTHPRGPDVYLRAIQLGVRGVVLKDEPVEVLIEAIQRIHLGEVWFNPSMMSNLIGLILSKNNTTKIDPEDAKIATLTEREREVIALIGEGLKNKQLADRLFISETTVRHHLTSIFDKLGVSDRLGLVIYAYQRGLAKPPWRSP